MTHLELNKYLYTNKQQKWEIYLVSSVKSYMFIPLSIKLQEKIIEFCNCFSIVNV